MQISLKAARVNASLTQKQAAQKMGVDVSTIINWECGRTTPSAEAFNRLCRLYRLTLEDIHLPTKPSENKKGESVHE